MIMVNVQTLASPVVACVEAILAWVICLAVYRRFLHPLSRIPGPFWNSITRLPAFCYNVIYDGQYYKKVEQYHAQYGLSNISLKTYLHPLTRLSQVR